jgi:hypothetical protein
MRVIPMNLVAEQILATGKGLRVSRQRLRAEHIGESARLERLVGDCHKLWDPNTFLHILSS